MQGRDGTATPFGVVPRTHAPGYVRAFLLAPTVLP